MLRTLLHKKSNFLLLWLGFSLTLLTSCSNDDANLIVKEHVQELQFHEGEQFTIDPGIADTHTSFYWYDSEKEISTEPVLTYRYDNPGEYQINLKTVKDNAVDFYRYKITIVPVTEQIFELEFQTNEEFTLDPEIEESGFSYQWFENDQEIAQTSTLTYHYSEPGDYILTLKATREAFTKTYIYQIHIIPSADYNYITLDLSGFDLSNGIVTSGGKVWAQTYDENAVTLTSGIFSFKHHAMAAWNYWSGFTVSNSADNQNHLNSEEGWVPNQWGTMPQGGVDGIGTPFLVSYSDHKPAEGVLIPNTVIDVDKFSSSVQIGANDDFNYKAVNVSLAISPWPYYGVLNGDQFARKFDEGDFFALHIYGVDKDKKLSSADPVTHYFVDYRNGISSISTTWENVDLSALGEVEYLLFFLETTDVGEWGANTALYFTLDKLTVEKQE